MAGQLRRFVKGLVSFKRVFLFVVLAAVYKVFRAFLRIKQRESVAPRIHGGKKIRHLLNALPTLTQPQKVSWLLASGDVQLIVLGFQMLIQETFCSYKFEREMVPVTINGKYPDKVTPPST